MQNIKCWNEFLTVIYFCKSQLALYDYNQEHRLKQ